MIDDELFTFEPLMLNQSGLLSICYIKYNNKCVGIERLTRKNWLADENIVYEFCWNLSLDIANSIKDKTNCDVIESAYGENYYWLATKDWEVAKETAIELYRIFYEDCIHG